MAPTLRPCPASCGQLVLRARTVNAKTQFLNPDPDPDGNVAVYIDHMDNVRARGLRKGEKPADYEVIYMPHKATCAVERALRARAASQSQASVIQLRAYSSALARHAAAARSQRGRRPAPPVTGIRYNPGRTK